MPRIASDGPDKAYYVIVCYVSDKWDISHRRPIAITVAEKVCEEAGDQCSYVGDYLSWNGPLGRQTYQPSCSGISGDDRSYSV